MMNIGNRNSMSGMDLNADTFRKICEALYGATFTADIARELRVGERTVRSWATGRSTIPPGIWDDLRVLCRKRSAELAALSDQIA